MSSRRISHASLFITALSGALFAAGTARAEAPKPKAGPLGMKFVRVPNGTNYYLGGGGGKPGPTWWKFPKDCEIAIYTVTQGQWQELMGNNPSHFSRTGAGKDKVKDIPDANLKRFPVERVSWADAREFIKKLNEKERGHGWLYRLPSVQEWDAACRGAVSPQEASFWFYFDKPTNDLSSDQANFNGEKPAGKAPKGKWLGRTTRVGSYRPNQLGLYDMHGNVEQWCTGGAAFGGSIQSYGGGSWSSEGRQCQALKYQRGQLHPHRAGFDQRSNEVGFRLVRQPSGRK